MLSQVLRNRRFEKLLHCKFNIFLVISNLLDDPGSDSLFPSAVTFSFASSFCKLLLYVQRVRKRLAVKAKKLT